MDNSELSDAAQTASIQIYNTFGTPVKQETLNINEKEITVSLIGLTSGNYSVILIINGTTADSKQLIKH